jgi:hypothetical protein
MTRANIPKATAIVTATVLLITACMTDRNEGDVSATLINLHPTDGVFAEVGLVAKSDAPQDATAPDIIASAELDRDALSRRESVSFLGIKPGRYYSVAWLRDKRGNTVQEGVSPVIEIRSDAIASAPVMMTYSSDERCTENEKMCTRLPGVDMVLACGSDQLYHPVENCGSDGACRGGECRDGTPTQPVTSTKEQPIAVCDPSLGHTFTTDVQSPYFPLEIGHTLRLRGADDEDEDLEVTLTVLEDPVEIDGIYTRVVDELERDNGVEQQRSIKYYAEAEDGTVCFFGEDVSIFDDGKEVEMPAFSWRSKYEERMYPGIAMLANPEVGMSFQQQLAPMVSLDRGVIIDIGLAVTTELKIYNDTIWVEESSPLDVDTSVKVYAKGVGLVKDEALLLSDIQ